MHANPLAFITTVIVAIIGALGAFFASYIKKHMDFTREDSITDVKARLDLLTAQRAFADSLRAERTELLNLIKHMREDIDNCEKDKNKLWTRIITCEQDISALTNKLEYSNRQVEQTNRQLEQCHKDSAELKQKYDTLQQIVHSKL